MGHASVVYYYWINDELSDMSYCLSQRRYLTHICIVRIELLFVQLCLCLSFHVSVASAAIADTTTITVLL